MKTHACEPGLGYLAFTPNNFPATSLRENLRE